MSNNNKSILKPNKIKEVSIKVIIFFLYLINNINIKFYNINTIEYKIDKRG